MRTNRRTKMSTTIEKNINGVEIHKGKFGYYPCDKETYLKLKNLNFLFLQAQKQAARWHRWSMKEPQNQVVKKTIRNEQGQRIGYEVVGKTFEPPIDSPFCTLDPEKSGWELTPKKVHTTYGCERTAKTWWIATDGFAKEYIGYNHHGRCCHRVTNAHRYCYNHTGLFVDSFRVDLAYQQAKRPQANKDSIKALPLTNEQIDKLYKDIVEK